MSLPEGEHDMARSTPFSSLVRRSVAPLAIAVVALVAASASPAGATPQAMRWKLMPTAGYGTFTAVSGLAKTDLWVVGYLYDQPTGRDLPVARHWDGARFTDVNVPAGSPGYNHLEGVAMLAANDVWAVGYSTPRYYSYIFNPLIEHYDGTSWKVVPSPFQGLGELKAITAISATDVWAVGLRWTNPEGTLILHYDGTKWSTLSDGHADDSATLWGVAAVSASSVYMGGSAFEGGKTVPFTERWNGSAFVEEATLSDSEYNAFNAMAADPSGVVFGVGWKSPDIGYFAFTERYDGSVWKIEPTPDFGPPNSNLYGVVMTSPTRAWAVGYQSGHGIGPVIIVWNGSSWRVDPNPAQTCCTLYGVGRVGSTLWAVGDNLIMQRGI
jgi:hypothetical protein